MTAAVTPLEALRRLIAVAKWPDAHWFSSEADWNEYQGELGVAEMVVRDAAPSAPPDCTECEGRGFTYWGDGTPGNGFDVAPEPPEQECCQSCGGSGKEAAAAPVVPVAAQPALEDIQRFSLQEYRDSDESMYSQISFDNQGDYVLLSDVLEALAAAPAAQPVVPEGWVVTHNPPWPSFTDAANARYRYSACRVIAPMCTDTGFSNWTGATIEEALRAGCEALGLPYAAPSLEAQPAGEVMKPGMLAAAALIEKKAAHYLDENAETDHNDGSTVFTYGQAGCDYYNGLMELAEELQIAAMAQGDKA